MPQFTFEPKHYPTGPGCYLMRDAAGSVWYVGKAKNLRRRLGSHFRSGSQSGRRRRMSPAEYARAVAEAVGFLSRQHAELIREMKQQMADRAAQLRFEQASWIKHHDQDVLHFEADTVLAMHVGRGVVCGCTLGDRVADPRYLEQRLVAATGHRVRVTIAQAGRAAARA